MQMEVTKSKNSYFLVWTMLGMAICNITVDKEVWESLKSNFELFYKDFYLNFFFQSKGIVQFNVLNYCLQCVRVCSCVRACVRACVCVCVCVYTLSPSGFFRLQDVCDILEMFRSTIFCCEYCQGLLPSSFVSVSENVIFHPQRWKRQPAQNWRENDMIYWWPAKRRYILI